MCFRRVVDRRPRGLSPILIIDAYLLTFLVVFFVLYWSVCRWTAREGIRLPEIQASVPDDSRYYRRIIINITRDGRMFISDNLCCDQEVLEALVAGAKPQPDDGPEVCWSLLDTEAGRNFGRLMQSGFRMRPEVLINADERVPFKHIKKILDWCYSDRVRLCNVAIGARPIGVSALPDDGAGVETPRDRPARAAGGEP
jgi:biopolymer transport protein ExbD